MIFQAPIAPVTGCGNQKGSVPMRMSETYQCWNRLNCSTDNLTNSTEYTSGVQLVAGRSMGGILLSVSKECLLSLSPPCADMGSIQRGTPACHDTTSTAIYLETFLGPTPWRLLTDLSKEPRAHSSRIVATRTSRPSGPRSCFISTGGAFAPR